MAVEEIKPYNQETDKAEQVEEMFDNIAPSYDFMNHAMTFGLDRVWRNKAISLLKTDLPHSADLQLLDVACGTGDITFALADRLKPCKVTGIDLSPGMLREAEQKLQSDKFAAFRESVTFQEADCLKLPFNDDSFDAVTVAYGVRNFENLLAGYQEMRRVLKPGGIICVIELCEPKNWIVNAGYHVYSRGIIPLIGKLVSGDRKAYAYLLESIKSCPSRDNMLALMREAGFHETKYKVLFPGTVAVYLAKKA